MDVAYVFPALEGAGWRKAIRDSLNSVLGLTEAYQVFDKASKIQAQAEPGKEKDDNAFLGAFREMGMVMDHAGLDRLIPKSGPAIVVANHPFGGADAIALSALCMQQRQDCKIMANAIVSQLPGTQQWTIPLQILGEDGATQANRAAMKESLKLLRQGGLLIVFPAGAVSRWRNEIGKVADPVWSEHVARLAAKTGSPVLPVRFFGQNPAWFEILGILHPIIRSALIVRAFLAARYQKIVFRGGKMIEADSLLKLDDTNEMTSFIRSSVESIPEP